MEPVRLDFSYTEVYKPKTMTLKVTNTKSVDLLISDFSFTGSDYNLFSLAVEPVLPIKIPPSQSVDIAVQFIPSSLGLKNGELNIVHNAFEMPVEVTMVGCGVSPNIRAVISKEYLVKPNETVKVSVQAMDDLVGRNVKTFSFVLRYNSKIIYFKDIDLSGTLSNGLTFSTEGSKLGRLVINVTNDEDKELTGIGSLIDLNFLGLLGDSCGTHLILDSFVFNSEAPPAVTENGYCQLFGRCGDGQTWITNDVGMYLYQNSPNPVSEGHLAIIQYKIGTAGITSLTIYDILGREVAKLVNEYKSEGIYTVNFNTKGLSSGVYFYRLRTPGYEGLKKMLIVK
jgi:hypothetical protein